MNNTCRGDYMKFNISTIMVMLGGAGIAGYLYMRNHPDMVCYMKDAVKDTVRDTSRKVYNMLDEED